jgi:hypothetical protein
LIRGFFLKCHSQNAGEVEGLNTEFDSRKELDISAGYPQEMN